MKDVVILSSSCYHRSPPLPWHPWGHRYEQYHRPLRALGPLPGHPPGPVRLQCISAMHVVCARYHKVASRCLSLSSGKLISFQLLFVNRFKSLRCLSFCPLLMFLDAVHCGTSRIFTWGFMRPWSWRCARWGSWWALQGSPSLLTSEQTQRKQAK